ncbi:EAL domain-containing protein [Paenibacillus hamazuiensis]|uniref:bifunctional diguanylate cyclase/phosphodiesterase n=1 Tax=Paenibacillus hamazuiensis TaxID=2936508 RepID=UPI00200D39B2|nr:EAL domain-containing protein [Paenibacillus hamazuiensis]
MKLQNKITVYIGVTTFLLLSLLYLISEREFVDKYKQIELEYARDGMKRVLLAFFDEYSNLGAITINYAGWDDTYRFVARPEIPPSDDPYLRTNYPDSLFQSSRLSAALLFNTENRVYFAKAYDVAGQKPLGYPYELIDDLLGRHSFFIRQPDASSRKQGIVVVGGKPLIAAAYPVLTSDNEGPVRGTLVFARWLDGHYMDYISDKADTSLSYSLVDPSFAPPPGAGTVISRGQSLPYWADVDDAYIHSHAVISDIDNNPAIVLEYTLPRDFSIQAQKSIRFYMLFFAASGLAFLLLVSFVLHRTLFRRLNGGIAAMKRIETKQDFSLRIAEYGGDELTELEKSFNRMMTSLEGAQQKIVYQADHDAMTGLANRKGFFAMLEEKIRMCSVRGMHFTVLFVDLDRFKLVNDTFGHHIGDLLLKEAAKRIQSCLQEDDFLCRLGGDEFCIITGSGYDDGQINRLASAIQNTLDSPFMLEGHQASISASIGISKYPEHGTDSESLLQHSDAAMLDVKESGKASFRWYTDAVETQRTRRLMMENLLRKAIENNELLLHYQPKWDVERRKVTGVEALLRWRNPQLGAVSPAEFIPIAEASGMINEIGEWVMRTACRQYAAWKAEMKEVVFRVAVNVSGVQLLQPNFVGRTRDIFREEQVDPIHFELEVTESFAIANFDDVIHILNDLRGMGFVLSIDDFGAGYSSLKYLYQLPVQSMKIDKSLTDRLEDSSRSRVIVSTLIDMAHRLNLSVVAEGVETSDQLNLLQHYHCDWIQGYLISKPVPAEEIPGILKQFRAG